MYHAKKIKNKIFLFKGEKKLAEIKSPWVKNGDQFKRTQLEAYGYGGGTWQALHLINNFQTNNFWTQFKIIVKCPCCNQFKQYGRR